MPHGSSHLSSAPSLESVQQQAEKYAQAAAMASYAYFSSVGHRKNFASWPSACTANNASLLWIPGRYRNQRSIESNKPYIQESRHFLPAPIASTAHLPTLRRSTLRLSRRNRQHVSKICPIYSSEFYAASHQAMSKQAIKSKATKKPLSKGLFCSIDKNRRISESQPLRFLHDGF